MNGSACIQNGKWQIVRGAVAALALFLQNPDFASVTGDFEGLAICTQLFAIPNSAALSDCNAHEPLLGVCRFSMPGATAPIEYLIENGVVLQKSLKLRPPTKNVAPYGMTHKDTPVSAARKIRTRTGLSSEHWGDNEDPKFSYLQSDSVNCDAATAYSIYVWFEQGRATRVSVSTLSLKRKSPPEAISMTRMPFLIRCCTASDVSNTFAKQRHT